jgi:anthranilate phosphoribosyltransferase
LVRIEQVDPARLGIRAASAADLKGGDPAANAQVVRDLVTGKPGPVRDAVLLNAAGAIAAHRGLSGDLHADLRDGLVAATDAVDSGASARLLERWIGVTTELRAAE